MARYLTRLTIGAMAAAFVLGAPAIAPAQQRPPQVAAQDDPKAAEAKALLMRMADRLATAQSFSVDMQAGFDVVQASGQKIEFSESRQILLNRPDDVRVETVRSDGTTQEILFDGKQLVFFDRGANVFSRLDRTGSVDQLIGHLVYDLDTPVPLSALLVTKLSALLGDVVQEVAVVERTTLAGQPAIHLAARTPDVDFQVWTTLGDQPVPLRIVITYKNDRGQPQFWANLGAWNFSPALDVQSFVFVPPAGAEQVAFLVPATPPGTKPSVGR